VLLLQGGSWGAYLLLLHQRLPPGGVFGSKRLHLVLRVLQSWQTATQLIHDWGVTSSSRDHRNHLRLILEHRFRFLKLQCLHPQLLLLPRAAALGLRYPSGSVR
jgi:hypothetical protein